MNASGPLVSNLWPLRMHGWLGLGAGGESAQWCALGFREGRVCTYRVSHTSGEPLGMYLVICCIRFWILSPSS